MKLGSTQAIIKGILLTILSSILLLSNRVKLITNQCLYFYQNFFRRQNIRKMLNALKALIRLEKKLL